jgi:hypothetical protein
MTLASITKEGEVVKWAHVIDAQSVENIVQQSLAVFAASAAREGKSIDDSDV